MLLILLIGGIQICAGEDGGGDGDLGGREKRNAQEYLESIRHDFDMNFNFQLRKLGIRQGNTSKQLLSKCKLALQVYSH